MAARQFPFPPLRRKDLPTLCLTRWSEEVDALDDNRRAIKVDGLWTTPSHLTFRKKDAENGSCFFFHRSPLFAIHTIQVGSYASASEERNRLDGATL